MKASCTATEVMIIKMAMTGYLSYQVTTKDKIKFLISGRRIVANSVLDFVPANILPYLASNFSLSSSFIGLRSLQPKNTPSTGMKNV